jgi:hypothetical protein
LTADGAREAAKASPPSQAQIRTKGMAKRLKMITPKWMHFDVPKCGKEWFLPRQESFLQAARTNLRRSDVQE